MPDNHQFKFEDLRGAQHKNDPNGDYADLAAEQWRQMGAQKNDHLIHDDVARTANLVFDLGKAVPIGFAAAHGNSDFLRSVGRGSDRGAIGAGLLGTGIMVGAEMGIDRLFFKDQTMRGGTLVADLGLTTAIMGFAPMAMRYKMLAGIAAHIGGRLLDKYAD